MNTSISIITPSYNQGSYIERTLNSVLSQEIPNLEYIIMDGGSTDNTLEILKKYSQQVNWYSEKDNGQSDALNKGFKQSKGNIIGWLNSDDVYYPNAIHSILDFFENNPGAQVVYGNANHIDENDALIASYPVENWSQQRLCDTCFLCQPAVFFRKNIFAQHGFLDDKLVYCMDYEYWLRLAKGGVDFVRIDKILAGSRLYAETKTLRNRVKVHKEINTMLKEKLGYVSASWLSNYAHIVLEHRGLLKPPYGLKFRIRLTLLTVMAALRWNRTLSKDLVYKIRSWF